MNKFWKEVVGGQVNTGVYQAGPRHAQKQYGSFKTGRPPRLPFQFVTYFEINPQVTFDQATYDKAEDMRNPRRIAYDYSSLVRAIDLPSVTFTVDKKNSYNKMKPIITTKDFKPFTMTKQIKIMNKMKKTNRNIAQKLTIIVLFWKCNRNSYK